MNKKNDKKSPRRLIRTMIVMVVYKYELMDEKISTKEIFENDLLNDLFDYSNLGIKNLNVNKIQKEQMAILDEIERNYDLLKKIISKFIRIDWTWSRIIPLIRSIFLVAAVELWKLDLGIVSNEYVEITKDFIPDDESYKFVNVVIEKIWKEYEKFKQKSN